MNPPSTYVWTFRKKRIHKISGRHCCDGEYTYTYVKRKEKKTANFPSVFNMGKRIIWYVGKEKRILWSPHNLEPHINQIINCHCTWKQLIHTSKGPASTDAQQLQPDTRNWIFWSCVVACDGAPDYGLRPVTPPAQRPQSRGDQSILFTHVRVPDYSFTLLILGGPAMSDA